MVRWCKLEVHVTTGTTFFSLSTRSCVNGPRCVWPSSSRCQCPGAPASAPQNCGCRAHSSSSSMSSSWSVSSDTSESSSVCACRGDTERAQRSACACSEAAGVCLRPGLCVPLGSAAVLPRPTGLSSSSSLLPP